MICNKRKLYGLKYTELALSRAKANGREETRYYYCELCSQKEGKDIYHLTKSTMNEFRSKINKNYDNRKSVKPD
jgi:hypothetical protein